jgi:hypothetical protein
VYNNTCEREKPKPGEKMYNALYYRNSWKKPEMKTDANIAERLEKILESEELSMRDEPFLRSLLENFKKYKGLTPRQFGAMEKIEKRYNPANKASRKNWRESFGEDKHQAVKIIAEYYARTTYWGSFVERVKEDPDYIPSKEDYEKIVNNRYAQRALEAVLSPAKFEVGAMVTLRQNVPWTHAGARYRGKDVLLLEVVTKGLEYKTYKACLMNNPTVNFEVQERHLKKPRKHKPYKIKPGEKR